MTISFNTIPVTIRTPGQFIEYDNTRAVQGTPAMPNVAYFIGPHSTGTVADGVKTLVPSAALAETYFGHGSVLAHMITAFKAVNPYTEVWACSAVNGAGVADVNDITITGPATATGTFHLYICGEYIPVVITSGDTANQIAANVTAAIIAYCTTSNIPIVATNPGAPSAIVTITALQAGEWGNDINVRWNYASGQVFPTGVGASNVHTTPGTGESTLTTAISQMGSQWFTTIVTPFRGTNATHVALDALETEMGARWHPMVMKDVQLFVGFNGTQGASTTYGNARNSKFTTVMGGGLSPTPTWIWASVAAALDTNEPDPARPRQTLLMTGCKAPAPGSEFTWTERNTLLSDGVSTYTVSAAGDINMERLITTYQTNTGGATDTSYLDITTMRTLAYLRYSLRTRIALRFPRHKLASDGTNFGPGQAIVTPAIIKSEIISLFKEWERDGLAEGIDQFITDILVERNSADTNRVDVRLSPDLMNQFMSMAGQIQFIL